MKKKEIAVTKELDDHYFEGSLENLRLTIVGLIEEYGKTAHVELEYDEHLGVVIEIHYKRLETDKELEARKKKAAKDRERRKLDLEKKEEQERKELARLKKKYEEE